MSNYTDRFEWSDDIEDILNKIRINCVTLTRYHKEKYYEYKGYLKYFRIPTIILSAITSVVSVGFKPYMDQNTISITTCFIGLSVGIINSIELFLTIQTIMEKSLNHSKDFYLLSIDIYKTLLLDKEHRYISGKDYLENRYTEYCKLIENAELINQKINDSLLPIESSKRSTILGRIFQRDVSNRQFNTLVKKPEKQNKFSNYNSNLKIKSSIRINEEKI